MTTIDTPELNESYLISRLQSQQSLSDSAAASRILSQPTLITVEEGGTVHSVKTLPGRMMELVDRTNPVDISSWAGRTLGPASKCKVMVIGDYPNPIENDLGLLWLDDYTKEFTQACKEKGVDCTKFYYTTAVKHSMFVKKSTLPKTWVEWSRQLLEYEVALTDPDVIVLLGAKALKAVCGAKAKLSDYQGVSFTHDKGPYAGKTMVCCLDPSSIIFKPENRDQLKLDLAVLQRSLGSDGVKEKLETEYIYCMDTAGLLTHVTRIMEEYTGWLAVDCEWSGQTPQDGDLRCIQISWAPGKALVPVFIDEAGNPSELQNNLEQTWKILNYLFEANKTRLIGHFIRADLPWLAKHGTTLGENVLKGWDTALAGHLLNENWRQALEIYTLRYTDMGRYDDDVKTWIKENKADVDANGFQHMPLELLLPYAAADADATFRIFLCQFNELYGDPNNKDLIPLFENVVMPATMPILEMETNGIQVDSDRMVTLARLYSKGKNELKSSLQADLNWPDFNPDSPDQKVEALFGIGKVNSQGETVLKSPPDAHLKSYMPVKRTDDGKKWSEVLDKGLLAESRPSTDKASLQTLLIEHPDDQFLKNILYYSAVSQAVKTFTGEYDESAGAMDTTKGILSKVWPDGKVHCRIRQTVETGRYGHSGPNMAQIPKSAENILSDVFEEAVPSIRSCFVPEPGWCFVDADWVAAELYVMAWLSGDANMQERLLTPNVDFHSETAVDMFQLQPPPADWEDGVKGWLKAQGESHLRTIAKTITFGIAYGRGAAAIKEEVYRQGVDISVEEAQEAINKFKTTYPQLSGWLLGQKELVTSQGYVSNAFGRRRRFEATQENEVLAHQQRQAMNMPIQGTVGDLMSLSLVNLHKYKEDNPHLNYKILMSVHDQILTTCPIEEVQETIQALQTCMCDLCIMPGYDLELQIDPEVSLRWGTVLSSEEAKNYGIDLPQ